MLWNQIARQAPVFKGEDARYLLRRGLGKKTPAEAGFWLNPAIAIC